MMTNKTESPARIWASTGLYYDYVTDWSEGSWYAVAGDGVPYIRADLFDAKIVEATLATIKANVPPLVWDEPDADPYQHQMSGAYEVTKLGHLYFHFIKRGDISTDLIGNFGTIEAAKAAAQAHHVAQLTGWMDK